MALIGCPECRKKVSENAIKCVHCGYVFKVGQALNIRKQEIKAKNIAYLITAIIAIFVWYQCS